MQMNPVVIAVNIPNDTFIGYVQHDVADLAAKFGATVHQLIADPIAGGPISFRVEGPEAAVQQVVEAARLLVYERSPFVGA